MKYTWNIHGQCQKIQRHLYSTDSRRGLASGVTQMLGLASGVTQIWALGNAKIYQHVGIFCIRWHKSVALGVQANASTQREWFCVAVEYRLNSYNDVKFVQTRGKYGEFPVGRVWEVYSHWGGCGGEGGTPREFTKIDHYFLQSGTFWVTFSPKPGCASWAPGCEFLDIFFQIKTKKWCQIWI